MNLKLPLLRMSSNCFHSVISSLQDRKKIMRNDEKERECCWIWVLSLFAPFFEADSCFGSQFSVQCQKNKTEKKNCFLRCVRRAVCARSAHKWIIIISSDFFSIFIFVKNENEIAKEFETTFCNQRNMNLVRRFERMKFNTQNLMIANDMCVSVFVRGKMANKMRTSMRTLSIALPWYRPLLLPLISKQLTAIASPKHKKFKSWRLKHMKKYKKKRFLFH